VKVTVRDESVLRTVRPSEVAAYLRAEGWAETRRQTAAAFWEKSVRGDDLEVLLPLEPTFRDYARRVGDMLEVLEVAENRSQLDIYADLTTTLADVGRVRLHGLGTEDGTMALLDGVKAIQELREIASAAACATVSPRACYRSRKPAEAEDFLMQLRLGQSDRGSYVFTIQSPVPPALTPDATVRNGTLFELDEPFSRRAMTTLARAVEQVRLSRFANVF
jgi:hypothetical protein